MTPVGSQVWFGGMIELVCGLLIAVGLFTRPAAFLASGTMAVAYLQFHWKLSFAGGQWLPAVNHGEPALIYCFLFLFVAAHGGGAPSLDALRNRAQLAKLKAESGLTSAETVKIRARTMKPRAR